jgi:hypothetical protein
MLTASVFTAIFRLGYGTNTVFVRPCKGTLVRLLGKARNEKFK